MRSDTIKKGPRRAPHRSLLRATGLKDGDFNKPFIGVANSFVEVIPGHMHLGELVKPLKASVRAAGAVPFEFNTIGVDDGIAMGHRGMRYSLPSRELIADAIETMALAHCFDGLVMLGNCDKIVPGMLMAAMRLDIPAIYISGGPMSAGVDKEGNAIDLASVFEGVGSLEAGAIDQAALDDLERNACPTCGSCSGMFTANSMNCLAEALGMALPGTGTILATDPRRAELVSQVGERIVALVAADLTPRQIVTAEAIDNAFILDIGMGGSTNTVLHTLAIAHEAGVDYSLERLDQLSRQTPYICKVAPSGDYHVEDVDRAGGVMAILAELARAGAPLHPEQKSVAGPTLGELYGDKRTLDADVIRTPDNVHSARGGLAVLFGNLAPEGAVI
ncbi:MAG: dihydroxy-acid dehydratase, partial [Myxococcota bacterium]